MTHSTDLRKKVLQFVEKCDSTTEMASAASRTPSVVGLNDHSFASAKSLPHCLYIALTIIGVTGLVLIGAGVTGLIAHQRALPSTSTLNLFKGLGKAHSILLIAGGGIMCLNNVLVLIKFEQRRCNLQTLKQLNDRLTELRIAEVERRAEKEMIKFKFKMVLEELLHKAHKP